MERTRYKCKKRRCGYCKKVFFRSRDLRRHERVRKNIDCIHCNRRYCNLSDLQKHLRSVNTSISNIDLNNPLSPRTGYEYYAEYQQVIERNINRITDKESIYKKHTVINYQIDSNFTYNDLYKILERIYATQVNVFKLNLTFILLNHI